MSGYFRIILGAVCLIGLTMFLGSGMAAAAAPAAPGAEDTAGIGEALEHALGGDSDEGEEDAPLSLSLQVLLVIITADTVKADRDEHERPQRKQCDGIPEAQSSDGLCACFFGFPSRPDRCHGAHE